MCSGAALENLSAGRVAIAQESSNTLGCAVSIAVRYGALRRQFGTNPDSELPLIDYPTHVSTRYKAPSTDFIGKSLKNGTFYGQNSAKIRTFSKDELEVQVTLAL